MAPHTAASGNKMRTPQKQLKQRTIEELFRTPLTKKPVNTIKSAPKSAPISLFNSKTKSSAENSKIKNVGIRGVGGDGNIGSPLCQGMSMSTGLPCKRPVIADNYCYQHKVQIDGQGTFGIRKNIVSSTSTQITREENLKTKKNKEIRDKDKSQKKLDFGAKKDSPSTTVIMIRLDNNVEVKITQSSGIMESTEIIQSDIKEDGSTEVTRSDIPEGGSTEITQSDAADVEVRLPLESPAFPDDSFLETTNKEFFRTPAFVTPSNDLELAPLLSISPTITNNPLYFEPIIISDEEDSPSPPILTPVRNQKSSKKHQTSSIPSNKTLHNVNNVGSGSITPTRSRNQIHIDLTTDSHSSFIPISPSRSYEQTFCRGKNIRNNKKCPHKIKLGEQYCQHHKQIMLEQAEIERALFVPGRSKITWVRFKETKRLLISEMEKPISDKDEAGFIYAYRLVEVGRTSNVPRRLYQWSKHCGYTPQLIELFPDVNLSSSFSSQESMLDSIFGELSLSNEESSEKLSKIIKCKYTHRVERLIHIELSEKYRADVEICSGCGTIHQEWFKVNESFDDDRKNHGWEEIRKVIVHWITYVEKIYENRLHVKYI
ncbi:5953_t:CDS:2 [Diversispora eburnea]|uniref:5953_t:CDS:1 n=1 Tax=Diversispora eburnea TaxID=1213867 RepID=A0A9N8ZSZ3_9GLOM|nr:5953_t:CDS:2 [Diversispora eburnea]